MAGPSFLENFSGDFGGAVFAAIGDADDFDGLAGLGEVGEDGLIEKGAQRCGNGILLVPSQDTNGNFHGKGGGRRIIHGPRSVRRWCAGCEVGVNRPTRPGSTPCGGGARQDKFAALL